MRKESEAMQRETCKLRFYCVKVGNAITVTDKEDIVLGVKGEAFGLMP